MPATIHRKSFFDQVKGHPLGKSLKDVQVKNMNAIIDEFERRQMTLLPMLAYFLATVLRECGTNMAPVREGFAKTDAAARAIVKRARRKYAKVINGQVYYGRGYVQLTFDRNYKAMGDILKIDLLNNPDKALDPAIATQIMFEGMLRGKFGRKLSDFIAPGRTDFKNARRSVNVLDHADEIAGNARLFLAALHIAS